VRAALLACLESMTICPGALCQKGQGLLACPSWQGKQKRGQALRSMSHVIQSQLQRLPGAAGQVRTWCAVFAAGGAVAFLSCLLQQSGFAAAGMELTRGLRLLLLSTLLRQARTRTRACVSLCTLIV